MDGNWDEAKYFTPRDVSSRFGLKRLVLISQLSVSWTSLLNQQ